MVAIVALMLQSPTQLYRHYDEAGVLLYVGISYDAQERLRQHRRESHWSHKIARMTVVNLPSRIMAVEAETKAIREERPLYNIEHSTQHSPRLYWSVGIPLRPVHLEPQAIARREARLARNAARQADMARYRSGALLPVFHLTDQRPAGRWWRLWRRGRDGRPSSDS